MAGVAEGVRQFYCSFMNKTKTRQLGGGPGVGGLKEAIRLKEAMLLWVF